MTKKLSPNAKMIMDLRENFPEFARKCMKIQAKKGGNIPFEMNKAQRHIHDKLEEQRERLGFVRALVLKGRQQGASTVITGRYYWKASGMFGGNIMILTHELKATENLFNMVKRFHQNMPKPLRPHTGSDTSKTLWFDKLDTRYMVATAGASNTGRSQKVNLFHGSEVAFWPNAKDHMAGIGQAVPHEPGTEVILESTANGIANVFHEMWQDAEAAKSEYIPIFVPWFWQEEYYVHPPEKVKLDSEEIKYKDIFGLNNGQMLWRRMKIRDDFRGDSALFDQEYPATQGMAFRASAGDAMIDVFDIEAAAKPKEVEAYGPKILGVDPSEYGDDETVIIKRHGRVVYEPIVKAGRVRPMEIVGVVARIIEEWKPDMVFVDATGLGAGVFDRLQELGYRNVVRVIAGSSSSNDERWRNRRAEMWDRLKEWLKDQPCLIPSDQTLMKQLGQVTYTYDSSRRLMLDSKEKMRKEGFRSPDRGDALALTFSYPVVPKQRKTDTWRRRLYDSSTEGGHMSA